MAQLDRIRNHGAIPERRHDAFLLALLLAVLLNIAFFAIQALLPRLTTLLQSLGANPPASRQEEHPFVLVDPSLLDDTPPPDIYDATSTVNRQASQLEETPDESPLPKEEQGVDELLTLPKGTFGELDPGVDSEGDPEVDAIGDFSSNQPENVEESPNSDESAEADVDAHEAGEASEALQMENLPEAAQTPDLPEPAPEPVQETAEPMPEPPEPIPDPVPTPEPIEEYVPPPPMEETPEPEPSPEPPPETYEPPPEIDQAMVPDEPYEEAEPTRDPEPISDLIDLAMLPTSDEGLFSPQSQRFEDLIQPVEPVRQPPPQYQERRDYYQPQPQEQQFYQQQPQYQEPAQQVQEQQNPDAPVRPKRRQREGGRQAQFREMGTPSESGGAPPRKNMSGKQVDMFGDPYMALLRDRYPEYMIKMLRQLQASLNRTMVLYPNYYATGQSGMFFRISPEGKVSYYELLFPAEGVDDTLRMISRQTLLEAAPFDPPPQEMLNDPAFQRMRLTVNIY